jgi:tetratricopeptide (TPR) repeat protein
MGRLFENWFNAPPGRSTALSQARAAELRGDLVQAAALFAMAGQPDEAARVTVLRGDHEPRPSARLAIYREAVSTASEASAVSAEARFKHASTVVAAAAGAPLTEERRHDLFEAALELEALGQNERAAEAYARAGDVDRQARALEHAGSVEKLDALLDGEHSMDRRARRRRNARGEFSLLVAGGARREATAFAIASGDEALARYGQALSARRAAGCSVRAVVRGRQATLLLGTSVVVGRAPEHVGDGLLRGRIVVPSAALSRAHLAIARKEGVVVVRDLGSRFGTSRAGVPLKGDVPVDGGIDLELGGQVELRIEPAPDWDGAVAVEVGGLRYIASLGPCWLGIGRWRLEQGVDGWVELATDDQPPAFVASMQWPKRATLVTGDAIASERGRAPEVIVLP